MQNNSFLIKYKVIENYFTCLDPFDPFGEAAANITSPVNQDDPFGQDPFKPKAAKKKPPPSTTSNNSTPPPRPAFPPATKSVSPAFRDAFGGSDPFASMPTEKNNEVTGFADFSNQVDLM